MSNILMLCHDQYLDRRVVSQAQSLIHAGHGVTLLALSFHGDSQEEITPEGIKLVRIGLNHIVPENPTYTLYMERQWAFNRAFNAVANRYQAASRVGNRCFRLASRVNWFWYRCTLWVRYRNRFLGDPLPFRSAFVKFGAAHPADLIQVHDLPALEAGVELVERWKVPLVYDAHELYPEQRCFSDVQKRICREKETQLIARAQVVFAVNASIAEQMAERYGITQPVTLLNALDPPDGFDPQGHYDLIRKKLNLSPKRKILLFQGGFAPHRNLEKLVRAMLSVRAPDIDLVMLGFGDFGAKLRSRSERLGLLGRRVHFLSAVPQAELLQHSASADMGIIPYPHVDLNSYYCTPNKLFEFIQAELPILANESPELRRFVANEGFGVVAPLHTAGQIARAVDLAFSSPDMGNWKNCLRERRAAFAWAGGQEKIYLNALAPFLKAEQPLYSVGKGSTDA